MKRRIFSYRMPPHHRHTVIATRSVPNVALSSRKVTFIECFMGCLGQLNPPSATVSSHANYNLGHTGSSPSTSDSGDPPDSLESVSYVSGSSCKPSSAQMPVTVLCATTLSCDNLAPFAACWSALSFPSTPPIRNGRKRQGRPKGYPNIGHRNPGHDGNARIPRSDDLVGIGHPRSPATWARRIHPIPPVVWLRGDRDT